MKKKVKRPKLGQEIESVSVLIRVMTEDPDRGTDLMIDGEALENPLAISKWHPHGETVKGIYAGFRSISNIENDRGHGYVKTKTFEAWIVYTGDKRKPVYVLPLDVLAWDGAETKEEADLYNVVDQFGEKMKTKIYESLAAGKAGWNTARKAMLLGWLKGEVAELEDAMLDGESGAIAGECVDVANYAMFVWARTRGGKA